VAIVIGDVSGHGIPSALLMAAVRSSLRQRVLQPGSIGQIVCDVNRQFQDGIEPEDDITMVVVKMNL